MSIQELSRKTGISASYIVRIESGERRNPTFTLLEKLLVGLGEEMETFLQRIHEG
ncbi:MAG: hypothetical protein C6P35_00740 [Cohnella sp.]|uniref:helix-turn-helix domain-containing protein n=1 Tax=Cohnella sp. TaxID=1883426 RepID=UPI000E377E4E|nr:MAG: hypothetical protein C6P35_00740 [Cohnella sp.]